MNRSTAVRSSMGAGADRIAARVLRIAGDGRLALALLLVAGAWNAAAAALPDGRRILEGLPYAVLLGIILLSGMAAVAVRLPAAWREWRDPSPAGSGEGVLGVDLPLDGGRVDAQLRARLVGSLRGAGYRVAERQSRSGWSLAGVRHGWSRFAGLATHLAVVLVVVGAGIGSAFASEATFSLLPGQQAFLGPGSGVTDAVRLDRFDASFGADGRPTRLDTYVTFLRDGKPVEEQLVQVNRPGDFGGYLVHGWTYGPAARLRVTSLAGRPLHDAFVPLDRSVGGDPGAFLEVPGAAVTLGLSLSDAAGNRLGVTIAGAGGLDDAVTLAPGESRRVGGLVVEHEGLASYVTFLSRSDPGAILVWLGGGLLVAALAAALWLPRRRVTLVLTPTALRLTLRSERFDRPAPELERLHVRVAAELAGPR